MVMAGGTGGHAVFPDWRLRTIYSGLASSLAGDCRPYEADLKQNAASKFILNVSLGLRGKGIKAI